MAGRIFYFGRGSATCVAVEMRAGNYVRVFFGNCKTAERGPSALFDRAELYRLSQFFRALWQDHGQEIFTSKLVDDPCDEILHHDLDFGTHESCP